MTFMRAPALALLLAAILTAAGCGGGRERGKEQGKPVTVTGVATERVAMTAIADGVEVVGTVKAKHAAVIAARLPATVTGVMVQEGDRVGSGALLVTLEAAESTAQAASATASVDEATRALEEARARRRLAETTFARYHKLFQEQAVTRQELEIRRADQEVAEQGVGRAEARLAAAREGARAAQVVAGYTRITAPLAGTVTAKQAEPGMTVFPGTPLLTLEGDGGYRLEAAVPESQVGRVKVGQKVAVAIEGAAGPGEGRIVAVVPAADPVSRTVTVKVDVAGRGLLSGKFGRMVIPTGARQGFLVPRGAVVERGALTSLWVLDGQGVARLRLVKTGKSVGDRIEVLAGIAAGERIVTAGVEKLSEGALVQ